MTFDEYQKQALTTAIHNDHPVLDKTIWALAINGEAGEVAEKWKKIVTKKQGVFTSEDAAEIGKELGDVLWYMALLAHDLGLSFDDIANNNLSKLKSRKERDLIFGDGDNR